MIVVQGILYVISNEIIFYWCIVTYEHLYKFQEVHEVALTKFCNVQTTTFCIVKISCFNCNFESFEVKFIWSAVTVALDHHLMHTINNNYVVLKLKLIQVVVVMQLLHSNLSCCCFYNNQSYSGSKSDPNITSSQMSKRSTCLYIVLVLVASVVFAQALSDNQWRPEQT